MKTIEQLCTELKDLTWHNEHTQAKLEIANHFRLDKFFRIFKAIEQIGDAEGYLPGELEAYRSRKGIELLNAIKQEYGIEVFNKVYNSL